MWRGLVLAGCLTAGPALACDRPVCLVDATRLALAQIITFDDQPSAMGVGRPVVGVLALPGAQFGERFAGQNLTSDGDFDRIGGHPLAPLTILPGEATRNMSVMRLFDTNVLSGDGAAGFPNRSALGEGALAVLFDRDQAALRFSLRGGEGGVATVSFLRRDGSTIDTLQMGPLAEDQYGFVRRGGEADIAGLIITNDDPDGIAIDSVAFDGFEQTS